MTTDLKTYLHDDNVPLRRRVARIDKLLARCDQYRGELEALQTVRQQAGLDTSTRDALQSVLQRPEAELRWVALSTLQCCFPDDASLRDVFIEQLHTDPEDDIRHLAVRALMENYPHDSTAQQAVIALFEHADPDMRAAAIYRLGKTGTAVALHTIRAHLQDTTRTDWHDRYWYLRALNGLSAAHNTRALLPRVMQLAAALPEPAALAELDEETHSHIHGIAFGILGFVQRHGDADDLHEVIQLAQRYDAPMLHTALKRAAARQTELATHTAAPLAERLLDTNTDTYKRARLLRRLATDPAHLPDDPAARTAVKAALLQLLHSNANGLRVLATAALVAGFGAEPDLKPRLLEMFTAEHAGLRQAALGITRHYPPDDSEVLETLLAMLESAQTDLVQDALLALHTQPHSAATSAPATVYTTVYASVLLHILHSANYAYPERAALLHACARTARHVDLSAALPTLEQMVYSLPLRPADEQHPHIDTAFAAILDYMLVYADDDGLEICERYIAQFHGPRTDAALAAARAVLQQQSPRPPKPTVAPATLSIDLLPTHQRPTDAPTTPASSSSPPFTLPSPPLLQHAPSLNADIPTIRQFIDESLYHMHYEAVPDICKYVTHPARSVKIAAIRALGTFGDGRARLALEQATHDQNPAIRRLAANALARLNL